MTSLDTTPTPRSSAPRLVRAWVDVDGDCPMCDEASTVLAAIDIVIDGDQIAESCCGCGRLVRPFSWHGDDGLPTEYLGQGPDPFGQVQVFAWYETGAVGSVPAIDPVDPTVVDPSCSIPAGEVGRAVLAHLVGLDVGERAAEDFQAAFVDEYLSRAGGEWVVAVDEIAEWLEASR